MVAAPWRRLAHAARWKGSAPQTTTGEASVRDTHCQSSNCSAGTMDTRSTGSVRSPETTRRWARPGLLVLGPLGAVLGGLLRRRWGRKHGGVAGGLDGGHQVRGVHVRCRLTFAFSVA